MSILDTQRTSGTFVDFVIDAPETPPRDTSATVTPAAPAARENRRSRLARFFAALAHSGTASRNQFITQDRGAYQEYLVSAERQSLRD